MEGKYTHSFTVDMQMNLYVANEKESELLTINEVTERLKKY